ncbi:MAG: hypothetical protein WDN46_10540 [Methylocella sp.]
MGSLDKQPLWIGFPLAAGGALLSAFSSKFPEAIQVAGFYLGVALSLFGVLGIAYYLAKPWWIERSATPLFKAAQRACEETIEDLGKFTYGLNQDDPNEVLLWYCCALSPKVTISGQRPPSEKIEIYSDRQHRNDFDLRIEGKSIVARQRSGAGRWVNLSVKRSELKRAILDLKKWKAGA